MESPEVCFSGDSIRRTALDGLEPPSSKDKPVNRSQHGQLVCARGKRRVVTASASASSATPAATSGSGSLPARAITWPPSSEPAKIPRYRALAFSASAAP